MNIELKHTPGPWFWTDTGKHWNNDELLNLRVNCGEINHGEVGECICDTVYEKADATLISAAPELLEAAIRAYEILEANDIKGQALLLLAIAIKKATTL